MSTLNFLKLIFLHGYVGFFGKRFHEYSPIRGGPDSGQIEDNLGIILVKEFFKKSN